MEWEVSGWMGFSMSDLVGCRMQEGLGGGKMMDGTVVDAWGKLIS